MEDGKNEIFEETKISETGAEQPSESDRELLIFGEGDGRLTKERGVKYTKPRIGYFIIAGLVGAIVGVALTLFLVSRVIGGSLSKLTIIKDMGDYDSSVISELLQRIDATHFGETPTSKELIDKAAHALVDGMGDPYASYFTVKEYEDYTASFNGNYYGIGVLIQNPDGTGALIRRVYEGSFAEQAGLKKGDVIIAVGGKDVTNVSGDELVSLIVGDEGSSVEITFLRDGKKMTAEVTRGAVYIKRVDYFVLENNIGYLYLSSFSGNAEEEFKAALEDFKARGIRNIVIDLRDNPGGSLYTVVNICDMLLPKCTVCTMQGKSTPDAEYFNSDESMYDFNFVVLVNEYSASASEIFAGAMQDNGRAKIIGVKTYGKGVVQTTYKLDSDHGWLKLTTDAYYTPNGTNLGGTGITPDVIVELPEELKYVDIYTLYTEYLDQDTQLQAAIAELTK
ncbi:MAG: S41 family peptidase [Clostridiales bacterium]|nr:S41 family peptidase [Clostridiales bacterium]